MKRLANTADRLFVTDIQGKTIVSEKAIRHALLHKSDRAYFAIATTKPYNAFKTYFASRGTIVNPNANMSQSYQVSNLRLIQIQRQSFLLLFLNLSLPMRIIRGM